MVAYPDRGAGNDPEPFSFFFFFFFFFRGVGSLSQPRLNIFTVGNIYILMCLMCPYAFYNEVLWVPIAPKWGQAECCKSHEWKELIPVSLVHTIIPNKTQGLFSNLAYFRAKYRLLMAAMFVAGCILIGQSFWT